MQSFAAPQADRDSGSAQGPESEGLGASLLAGMRNNPLLTGALVAGLGAVTGPQMLKALTARMIQARAIDPYRADRVQSLIERLTPHADEATEAWKMVGGSGPTKLKFLGSGVDATTFQVTPGNSVLKLSKPSTHLGFDPHQIAETAPRNVMLPVLEHGKFQDFSGNPELSWFVQPRAHVLESFYDNQRREQALMRIGQTTPSLHSALQELEGLLQKEHPGWRLADTHSGNFGRWAGKDWVIDLGSMEHTPTRNALRHRAPAPEPPLPPQIPVRDTPITTPPGAPTTARGWFKDVDTKDLAGNAIEAPDTEQARNIAIELLERLRNHRNVPRRLDTPQDIRNILHDIIQQGRQRRGAQEAGF